MKRFACLTIFVATLALQAGASQDTYVISGIVSFPPTIDATNVRNESVNFNIGTSQPWDTSNTRTFTNFGTMNGSVGFRFDTAPRDSTGAPTAPRYLADRFVNRNGATVAAFDNLLANGSFDGSYVLVQATNVLNQGTLTSGAAGLVQIVGTNVTLRNSGVGVNAIIPQGSFNLADTNEFFPDTGIFDNYWAQTNMTFDSGGIYFISGSGVRTAIAPPHVVTVTGGFDQVTPGFSVVNPVVAGYSNGSSGTIFGTTNAGGLVLNQFFTTNVIKQAVFVGVSATTNLTAAISFSPSTSPSNFSRTVSVVISVPESDSLTSQSGFNTIYFRDTLASETNRGVLYNLYTGNPSGATFRPANYLLSRVQQGGGTAGNFTNVTTTFLYQPNFTNRIVTGEYAGYSAFVDNLVSQPPAVADSAVTNYPGRLAIYADSLDLTRTRMRAEGLLTLQARHLLSSSNAIADSPNLSYNLGSTNGSLVLQNLMQETVARLNGNIYAWSASWTNSYVQLIPNYDISQDPPLYAPITNTITVSLHTLILDATALVNEIPVTVYELSLHSTNTAATSAPGDVVVEDNGVLSKGLLIDGQSFTLKGRFTFSGALEDWTYTNAPILRYFTNLGTITIPQAAHFGDDGPLSYLAFVNRGTIQSQGQTIKSAYCELNGTNTAGSAFTMLAPDGKVETGRISANSYISFNANTLKFNRSLVTTLNSLYLNVTNALFDNGPTSSNLITCRDGFFLPIKPATGDLLGSSFRTTAPSFATVTHVWSGQDRGAVKAGFSNNVALGQLTPLMEGYTGYPSFIFSGAGVSNGLYVDLLDLSQLTDYQNQLQMDPNLVLYYAAAKLNFTPPGGQTPEEYLNGQFDGHLIWVSEFAGANSSVDVVINGNQTIQVNKALRNSTTIDSDADGVPNFYDATPFDGVKIVSVQRTNAPAGYLVSWKAAAGTIYRLEYKTNLNATVWLPVTTTTNNWTTNAVLTALDATAAPGTVQRYYRVIYNPNGP